VRSGALKLLGLYLPAVEGNGSGDLGNRRRVRLAWMSRSSISCTWVSASKFTVASG